MARPSCSSNFIYDDIDDDNDEILDKASQSIHDLFDIIQSAPIITSEIIKPVLTPPPPPHSIQATSQPEEPLKEIKEEKVSEEQPPKTKRQRTVPKPKPTSIST